MPLIYTLSVVISSKEPEKSPDRGYQWSKAGPFQEKKVRVNMAASGEDFWNRFPISSREGEGVVRHESDAVMPGK